MKILVVDDDLELLSLIAFALRQAGYLALEATDGQEALAKIEAERPDLIVLDYNLPRLNGLQVLQRLREGGDRTPVMMLTVRADEADQVRALDEGADDYLTKPFSPRTLLARVRALLRRAGRETPAALAAGGLELDLEQQRVRRADGSVVALTHLEFRLLQLLLANADRALTGERMTSYVWGHRGSTDRQLLKQLVHRLRQKIEPDPSEPRLLLTVPGVGYLLRARGEEEPPTDVPA